MFHRVLDSRAATHTLHYRGRTWLSGGLERRKITQQQQHVAHCGRRRSKYGLAIPSCSAAQPLSSAEFEGLDQVSMSRAFKTTLPKILQFGVPVLLIPLADPLMSLIDSVCIGSMADTLQLAALGPCSLIFNFSSYTFNALSIACVSLVAQRLQGGDSEGASMSLTCSLALGVVGGLVVCGVLQLWGSQLLAATGAEAAVLPHALAYLRIRALAAPAAVLVQVAQAGLLGQRDSLSPFRVVLASSTVSLLGDLLLIGRLGWGLSGAAWSTVLSQYLAVALLMAALQRSRVPLASKLPGRSELTALLDTFGLLTVFYLCKNVSYLMLQRTATALSAVMLAAHQPIWALWNLGAFCNTPLEQAALTFIPTASSDVERRETAWLLLALGAASGVLGAAASTGLPALCPQWFAGDPLLWPHMRSVGLQGSVALIFCGIDVASTGVLLALKDTSYVALAMMASMGLLAAFLWWMQQGAGGVTLSTVWWGLAVFFGLRAVQSFPRVLLRHLRPAGRPAPSAP